MDYKQILADIARAIVDSPDSVTVTEESEGEDIELTLNDEKGSETRDTTGEHA